MTKDKKQISVAFLLGSLNRGGAETLMLDCFNKHNLAEFKMIGVSRNGGGLENYFLNSGVQLFRLKPKHIFDFNYFYSLRQIFKKNQIQIIHAHLSLDALFAYIASFGLDIKLLLTFHGQGINDSFLSERIKKYISGKVKLAVFVSNFQMEYYKKKYNFFDNQVVIYNGIDFNKFKATPVNSIRKELNVKDNELLIGSIGNFTPGRDHLTLCKFIAHLKKQNIPFKFIFVGIKSQSAPQIYDDCIDFCKLNGLMNEVVFLGTRNDVPAILKELNVFLYSTVHDTFGIAVVEAMAMGVPVFVNDWEVMREITNEGIWATIYKSKNIDDLMDKFLDYYKNQDLYKVKARSISAEVKMRYSIEQHLINLNNLYTSVLNK